MADRSGLRLVGFIFASVTFAVMLTATMVVKGYSDGVYSLESAAIEGRGEMSRVFRGPHTSYQLLLHFLAAGEFGTGFLPPEAAAPKGT